MSSGNWPYILNLGNSIIGVAVLAMPFCFKQCGIILGIILLLFCTWLTLVSCQLLMKAAIVSRKRSYEFLAYYTFGAAGKFVIEIGMIGLQLGTLIAQIVVIGDLGPGIISKVFGFENSSNLRTFLIVFLSMCVGLPLGLLKDLRSVSRASTLCICFYTVFVIYVLLLSVPNLWTGNWYPNVAFWRPEGLFQTLPIFSLSFGCQTQLFLLYDSLPEPTLKSINGVISSAVNLCAVAYLLVGFFGYIAFYEKEVGGDIITLFPSTFAADMMKLFFVVSIAVTFPLIIYPCRASLYTLLFPQKQKSFEDLQEENHIPEIHFKFITVAIVAGSMIIGILVPNVEFILGMNGATMGTLICYIFPALFFVRVMANRAEGKHIAQLVMILGVTILLVSTFATLYMQDKGHTHPVVPKEIEDIAKPDSSLLNKPVDMPIVDTDKKNEKRIEPPVPDAPLDSVDKKSEKEEKKEEELPKKDGIDDVKGPDKGKTLKPGEVDKEKKPVDVNKPEGAKNTEKEIEKKADDGKDSVVEKKIEEKVEAVVAKEEHLKEREKKIVENEQKQQVLLEKLVEQQEEQKQLIHEQKQLLKELKDHKEKDHGEGNEAEGNVHQPAQGVQQLPNVQQPNQVLQQQNQGVQQQNQVLQQQNQVLQQQNQGIQMQNQGVQQQPVQGIQQQPVQGVQQPQQGVQQQVQGVQQPAQGIQSVQGAQQPIQGVKPQQVVKQPVITQQGQQQQVLNQPVINQQGQQPVAQLHQGLNQPLQGQQLLQQPAQGQQQAINLQVGGNQPLVQKTLGQQPQLANVGQQAIPAHQQIFQNQQQFAQQPLQQNLNQQGLNQQPTVKQLGNLQFVNQQAGGLGKGQGQQGIGQQGVAMPGQNLNNAAGDSVKNMAAVKQGVGMEAGNKMIHNRPKRELSELDISDVLKEVNSIGGKRESVNIVNRVAAINKVSHRR